MNIGTLPADQLISALQLITAVRDAAAIIASLEKSDIKKSVDSLVEAKKQADAASAMAQELSASAQKESDAAGRKTTAATQMESTAAEKLHLAESAVHDAVIETKELKSMRAVLDARAAALAPLEKTLDDREQSLRGRLESLVKNEQTLEDMKSEVQRRLDAVKAAAGG